MKKAILVVSFGTTYADTRKKTIDVIENKIKNNFPEYEIRRAYTAHQIIRKLKNRDNIHVDTPEEALQRLERENYDKVIVQPLHIIPGEEYDYIKAVVEHYRQKEIIKTISLGRPALYFKGGENVPDDYKIFIDGMKAHLNQEETFVLMGHGSVHPANACYSCLQQVLVDEGYSNVYISNVEGYPEISNIIETLMKDKVGHVKLKPLMLVSGDHARNDMASDEEDSWKTQLERQGIGVEIDMRSLGEIDHFQDIYVKHIEDAISGIYEMVGVSKKLSKVFV